MEATELPPLDGDYPDLEPEPDETRSANVIEALKAQRSRIAETRTLDVAVPGWGELLFLRLGPISAEAQARIVERSTRRKASTHYANVDFLIAACRGVYGCTPSDRELTQLLDDEGDPLALDVRLSDALGLGPVRSAREVVELLFARANSPTFAIGSVTSEWAEWATDASGEVDEAFLGESRAATR